MTAIMRDWLDASAFCGPWAFMEAPRCSLGEVVEDLGRLGAAGIAISPAEAVLQPEPMSANRRFLALAKKFDRSVARVYPVPTLDPSLPGWKGHLAECVESAAIRAIKIFPNYHGYDLAESAADELAGELESRGLALFVQLRMADERSHHPLMRVPRVDPSALASFAQRHPSLPVLACGAYLRDLKDLGPADNLHAELSGVESGWLLRDAVGALGAGRVLFGTHAPYHTPAAAVAKLGSDELAPDLAAAVAGGNLRRILGLPPSPGA